jgi:hypothetical protein
MVEPLKLSVMGALFMSFSAKVFEFAPPPKVLPFIPSTQVAKSRSDTVKSVQSGWIKDSSLGAEL